MAAGMIFVDVKVKAKCDFASNASAAITKVIEGAIKGSGTLTTDTRKDAKALGWALTASFDGDLDKDGRKFVGTLSTDIVVITGSGSLIKLRSNPDFVELGRPGKLGAGDVAALAEAMAEVMVKKAVPQMKMLKG